MMPSSVKPYLVPLLMLIMLSAGLYGCKDALDRGAWSHGYLPPLTQSDPDIWAHIEGDAI